MTLYRYHDCWDGNGGKRTRLFRFEVVRTTPKGFWIVDEYGKERWVQDVDKHSRKRYAFKTKERALSNFMARKNKQIQIMEHHVEGIKQALKQAEALQSAWNMEKEVDEFIKNRKEAI